MSEQVLAEGRLHPRWVLVGILDNVGRLWLAFLIALFNARELIWMYPPLILITLAAPMLRFIRFRYRLTTEALEITDGILARRERRIPIDRIQDVSHSQTPLRRLLKIVTITVETASSAGAEATLDALTQNEADALRRELQRVTRSHRGAVLDAPEVAVPLHRCSPGELTLLGLTDNRAGLLVLGALIVVQEISEVVQERFARALTLLGQYLTQRGTGIALTALLIFAALLVAGWIVSVAVTWLKFGNFTLEEREGVFIRRYGLLTTREQAMPRRYLQILRLEQTFFRRLLKLVVVRAENAGSALDPKGAQKTGVDVFVPAIRAHLADALVPRVLPGTSAHPELTRTSPVLWQRWGIRGALLAAALALAGAWRWPSVWWAACALIPVLTLVLGVVAHRQLGWAIEGDVLAVRSGIFRLHRSWMPRDRVQSVEWTSTPLDRWSGVVHLRTVVTGGGQLKIGYLREAEAERIAAFLMSGGRQAAARRPPPIIAQLSDA